MTQGAQRSGGRIRGIARLLVVVMVVNAVLFGARAEPAAACSCAMEPTPGANVDRAQAVFRGDLTRIEPGDGSSSGAIRKLYFSVDRVYKGTVERQVVVRTADSSASCGLGIEALGSYVIFATGTGAVFSSTLCNGGGTMEPAPTGLGEGYPPGVGATASSESAPGSTGPAAGDSPSGTAEDRPPWVLPLLAVLAGAGAVVVGVQVISRRGAARDR